MNPNDFPCMPSVCPPVGLYREIAEPEYRRWAAWSQTIIKGLGKWCDVNRKVMPAPDCTPAHVFDDLHNPTPSTEAQQMGTQYHRLLLEPARFVNEYAALLHPLDRRKTEDKATWAAMVAQYGEGNILTKERFDLLQAMARAAAANPLAKNLMGAPGETEVSGVFVDHESGETVKFRLDKLIVANGRHRILDLKTTKCAHPDKFQWDAEEYGYHVQAAVYCDGYASAADVDPGLIDYYVLAQEKTRPYLPVVFKMPPEWIDCGRGLYRAQLKVAAECMRTGVWPGYADNRVVDLHLPDRAMADFETAA